MTDKPTAEQKTRPKTTAVKSTKTANEAYGKYVKKMYVRAREAVVNGSPVAWVMAGALADEILLSMDVVRVFTENYAGVCAAKKAAAPFLEAAESVGFTNDICGYARTGIGFARMRKELGTIPPNAPEGGMPVPTFLVGRSTSCDIGFKWYQAMERYMDVPFHAIDVIMPPFDTNLKHMLPSYIEYQTEELKAFIAFVEKVLGRKMDYDKLTQVVNTAQESISTWHKCQQLRRAVPSPMGTEDHVVTFVPAYFMLGEPDTLQFYKELYAELKDRVDRKIGVIPNEKIRLLWAGGLPPWHNLGIFNYFESLGAVCATEMCYNAWNPYPEGSVPSGDVVERIAQSNLYRFSQYYYQDQPSNRKASHKGDALPVSWLSGRPVSAQYIENLVEEYKLDGLVMHATKSCRACTIGQISYRDLMQDHIKIPILFLESDIIDERDFSETDTKSKIDAFIENVASLKERRRQF